MAQQVSGVGAVWRLAGDGGAEVWRGRVLSVCLLSRPRAVATAATQDSTAAGRQRLHVRGVQVQRHSRSRRRTTSHVHWLLHHHRPAAGQLLSHHLYSLSILLNAGA